MSIATCNVNNLFERAKLFELEGFSEKTASILEDFRALDKLLILPYYEHPTSANIYFNTSSIGLFRPCTAVCSDFNNSRIMISFSPFFSHSAGKYKVCCGPIAQYLPK
jgi:hypothetical protein